MLARLTAFSVAGALSIAGTVCGDYVGLGATSRAVTTTTGDDLDVFELYALFDAPGDMAEAVAVGGTPTFPSMLVAGTGGFFQVTIFGSQQNVAQGETAVMSVPNLEYDSFLSMGVRQGFTGTPGLPTIQGYNTDDFNGGAAVVITDNGGWFIAPGSPEGMAEPFPPPLPMGATVFAPPEATHGVILGQFTVATGNTFSGDLGRLAIIEDGVSRVVENVDTPGTIFSFIRMPAGDEGACCQPDGACSIEADEATCTAIGGAFEGAGTICLPNPCAPLPGACCQFDGTCTIEADEQACDAIAGMFQGTGTVCTPNPCPVCTVMLSVTPLSATVCPGDPTEFCAIVSSGVPPYAYDWTGPSGFTATTECITVFAEGTYSVTVTDALGCTVDASGELALDVIDVGVNSAIACDGASAQLCADVMLGAPPFTYAWTGPTGFAADTQCIDVAVGGTYTVTVTDDLGCTGMASGELIVGDVDVSIDPIALCEGESAELCAQVTLGVPPFTYAWVGPGGFAATTECITVTQPGSYAVLVTDATGCTAVANGTLSNFPLPAAQPDDVIVCSGDPLPAAICANPGGGTPPYTFAWTGPGGFTADTECIDATDDGTYTVTVTDANGCVDTASSTLTIGPAVAAAPNDAIICADEFVPVTICSNPSGGTPPYTYLWSNGATTECIDVVQPGDYTVTVTDALGCTAQATSTLTAVPPPTVQPDAPVICEGEPLPVEICANTSSGTPPYIYLWSTGETTECIQVSDPGSYTIDVIDANGCSTSAVTSFGIAPAPMTDPFDVVICEGDPLPVQLCANAFGGTPPYTYLWNTGATTECIDVTEPGIFTVLVMDENLCMAVSDVSVTINPTPTAAPDVVEICDGDPVPVVLCANASGGTPPYTYAWDTGETTECITVLDADLYDVTITDANGCSVSASGLFVIFPSIDCNENGTCDAADIDSGTSPDFNGNGIPDECEPDCNDNGLPDFLDITLGLSMDCNINTVPDECDIAEGTSDDMNMNGVPDECEELFDCNDNGIPDDLDILFEISGDCNEDGVPDECGADCNENMIADDCDIADGFSDDCNLNGIPDECEPDCNENFVPDDCDLDSGDSLDCNTDLLPDECNIDSGDSLDCNANLIPDECDIANGAPDCNANDVPDECDIASGTSGDVNGNGVPDECECLPDIDGDGEVGFSDVLVLIGQWGICEVDCFGADLDGDGEVGFSDLLVLIGAWGACP